MGKIKAATLAQAPISVRRQLAIDPTDSGPPKQVAPRSKAAPPRIDHQAKPTKYTYALARYTCERRADGWRIARTPFGDEKTQWSEPFETIETAVLAIARRLATEVADRHTRSIEGHKLTATDPLYGLKPTTRLRQKKSASTT